MDSDWIRAKRLSSAAWTAKGLGRIEDYERIWIGQRRYESMKSMEGHDAFSYLLILKDEVFLFIATGWILLSEASPSRWI